MLCIAFTAHVKAQDSILIDYLMQRISAEQAIRSPQFIGGIFPSYIANHPHFSTRKKDNNIFFTALIDYTLRRSRSSLSPFSKTQYDSIHARTLSLYPRFKNKKGRNTYNFWRTDSAFIFPYTNWIRRVKKNTALPDDMDDTVLSLLAQDTDSAMAAAVHAQMQAYINQDGKTAKSIDKVYRRYKTYSVWYGKHFPAVLDVCVLSNMLHFVQAYNLRWTAADSAAVSLITAVVKSGDYIKKPLTVSPYYGNTSIVLYHLARLMSSGPIPPLEALKVQLITTAMHQFTTTENPLEKAILCTAIIRWGYVPPSFDLPRIAAIKQTIEHNDLPFFTGNIPSYFSNGLRQVFTRKGWGLFYHYCPAYNDALLLEYLTLKQETAIL